MRGVSSSRRSTVRTDVNKKELFELKVARMRSLGAFTFYACGRVHRARGTEIPIATVSVDVLRLIANMVYMDDCIDTRSMWLESNERWVLRHSILRLETITSAKNIQERMLACATKSAERKTRMLTDAAIAADNHAREQEMHLDVCIFAARRELNTKRRRLGALQELGPPFF